MTVKELIGLLKVLDEDAEIKDTICVIGKTGVYTISTDGTIEFIDADELELMNF